MNYPVPDFHPQLWTENAKNATGTRCGDRPQARKTKTPGLSLRGFLLVPRSAGRRSAHQPVPPHEAVETEPGDLPPLVAFVGEVAQRRVDLLEVGVGLGD